MEGANFADQFIRITKAIESTKARDWAGVLGISEQAVSKALKKKQIPLSWFYKISTKLNIPLEWLLNGQEPLQAEREKPTQQEYCSNCIELYKKLVLSQERELALTNENNELQGKITALEYRLSLFANGADSKGNTA
ncbi:MAG: helix-turn-helix domain containing protein [Desulfovibrio sp.]|jgi:hypothetical protein|nr:helix-turn-helix domain containing protein [Desulfovibrio sp.]